MADRKNIKDRRIAIYIYMLGTKLGSGQIWNSSGQKSDSDLVRTKLKFYFRPDFFGTELRFHSCPDKTGIPLLAGRISDLSSQKWDASFVRTKSELHFGLDDVLDRIRISFSSGQNSDDGRGLFLDRIGIPVLSGQTLDPMYVRTKLELNCRY